MTADLLPDVRSALPDHGLQIVQDGEPDLTSAGMGQHRGRFDGRLAVSCYCGRRSVLMTPEDVAAGLAPPPCSARLCRQASGWE